MEKQVITTNHRDGALKVDDNSYTDKKKDLSEKVLVGLKPFHIGLLISAQVKYSCYISNCGVVDRTLPQV